MEQNLFPDENVFSVSQITGLVKEVLETSFVNLKIEGEISNWRPSAAGHVYFTLKDEAAQLKAVIFRSSAYKLSFSPKDGDKVRCTGNITVYAAQGNYQIIVTKMEAVGSGNILQTLEERKRKLAAEGLFDSKRKRALPLFPKTLGVITSPTGAAIRDILNVAKRRNPKMNVIVFPALVQGDGAVQTIVKMFEIANFYEMCDVLIVGRGGGSLEDLLPFSDEKVVRAVANSKIPVISAVGHEIDWALCDYAADFRAPTPSAAAETAIPVLADLKRELSDYKEDLYDNVRRILKNARLTIQSFNPESLEIKFRSIQTPLLTRFENAKQNMSQNLNDKIKDYKNKIANCVTILENSSPQTIFERGYSMVADENGNVIRNRNQVKKDDNILITLANGKISANVSDTSK